MQCALPSTAPAQHAAARCGAGLSRAAPARPDDVTGEQWRTERTRPSGGAGLCARGGRRCPHPASPVGSRHGAGVLAVPKAPPAPASSAVAGLLRRPRRPSTMVRRTGSPLARGGSDGGARDASPVSADYVHVSNADLPAPTPSVAPDDGRLVGAVRAPAATALAPAVPALIPARTPLPRPTVHRTARTDHPPRRLAGAVAPRGADRAARLAAAGRHRRHRPCTRAVARAAAPGVQVPGHAPPRAAPLRAKPLFPRPRRRDGRPAARRDAHLPRPPQPLVGTARPPHGPTPHPGALTACRAAGSPPRSLARVRAQAHPADAEQRAAHD